MSLARRSLTVGVLLAVAACDNAKPLPPVSVPLATPLGVTLHETRGYRDAANIYVPGPVAYADANAQLAYIRPTQPGNAECTEKCAEAWVPVPGTGNYGINEANVQKEIPRIDALAKELGCEVIDMHAALETHPEMLPDRVHPNNEGAAEMAKAKRWKDAFDAMDDRLRAAFRLPVSDPRKSDEPPPSE